MKFYFWKQKTLQEYQNIGMSDFYKAAYPKEGCNRLGDLQWTQPR